MSQTDLDQLRRGVLDQVDRAATQTRWIVTITSIVEGIFLVLFFVYADLSDRLHILLMISSGLIYITLGLAILGLGSYVNLSTMRVLRAIELIGEEG